MSALPTTPSSCLKATPGVDECTSVQLLDQHKRILDFLLISDQIRWEAKQYTPRMLTYVFCGWYCLDKLV